MDKYEALLKQDRKTFHSADLALLWNIENKDTLNMTLKRYVDRGILKRIHKGFFSTLKISELNPLDLGSSFLNSYCYLSLESILAREGVIFQEIQYLTFVGHKTQKFTIGGISFASRQLKELFLNNTCGVCQVGNHFEATLERAVADILYYNPKYHFDNSSKINLDLVQSIRKEVGYAKS